MFPKPSPSYDGDEDGIVWVRSSRLLVIADQGHHIPCLVVNNRSPETDKVMIYFHGNAEDIGLTRYFLQDICHAWNVIIVD